MLLGDRVSSQLCKQTDIMKGLSQINNQLGKLNYTEKYKFKSETSIHKLHLRGSCLKNSLLSGACRTD